jgi:hypothetical protein
MAFSFSRVKTWNAGDTLTAPDLNAEFDNIITNATPAAIGAQTLDAELTAIAGLTSAANKLPYFTGSGTAGVADLTADARTLLDNTVAQGDLPYGSATNTWAQLAKGAANAHLFMNAAATLPEWASAVKIGTFAREMDAAGAPTDVAYTGVGFKPSAIIFIGTLASSFGVGLDNGTLHYVCSVFGTTPTYSPTPNYSIAIFEDAGKYQAAIVKTMDADGFTLTWTKASTPASATANVYYIAFR